MSEAMSMRTPQTLRRPTPTLQVPGSTQERRRHTTGAYMCGCGCGASVLVRLTREIHHFMMACFKILWNLTLAAIFVTIGAGVAELAFSKIASFQLDVFGSNVSRQIGSTVAAASAPAKSVVARRPLHGRLSRQSCLSTSTDIAYI